MPQLRESTGLGKDLFSQAGLMEISRDKSKCGWSLHYKCSFKIPQNFKSEPQRVYAVAI